MGCGGHEARSRPPASSERPRAVRALEDSGASVPLAVRPPLTAVRLAPAAPATPDLREAAPSPPLPAAAPDTAIPAAGRGSGLASDDALHPPIPRSAGVIIVPAGLTHPAFVELELRVDELGRVSDLRWADGSLDTALIRAASHGAATLTFYPALLRGLPVAVWCRQRFDFTTAVNGRHQIVRVRSTRKPSDR
jgi:hypothetical protein